MISRRNFIKASVLSNILLIFSGTLIQGCKKRQLSDLKYLSEREANTLRNFSMRLIPPGGDIPLSADDVGVVKKIDEALSLEDKDIQKQFSAALFIFEFLPLFSLRFSRFSALPEDSQIELMNEWSKSRWLVKRSIFNAIKDLSMFMFYTTPDVWKYMGYDGPLVKR